MKPKHFISLVVLVFGVMFLYIAKFIINDDYYMINLMRQKYHVISTEKKVSKRTAYDTIKSSDSTSITDDSSNLQHSDATTGTGLNLLLMDSLTEGYVKEILFAFLPIEFLHSFAHFLKSDSKYDSMQYCLNFIQGKVVIHAFPDRIQRDKYFLGNINRVFWNKGTILSVEEAAQKYVSGDPVLSDSETELLDHKANTIVKSLYYLYCIKGEEKYYLLTAFMKIN